MRAELEASWRAFDRVHGDGTSAHAAAVLGGAADQAIRQGRIVDLSPLKISYALNHAGMRIPAMPRKTIDGSDGVPLIALIRDLVDYLREYWGEADLAIVGGRPEAFARMSGLMLFELPYAAGSGRACLWNGRELADRSPFPQARSVALWEMVSSAG